MARQGETYIQGWEGKMKKFTEFTVSTVHGWEALCYRCKTCCSCTYIPSDPPPNYCSYCGLLFRKFPERRKGQEKPIGCYGGLAPGFTSNDWVLPKDDRVIIGKERRRGDRYSDRGTGMGG